MENFTISSDLIRGHIDTIILKSLFDSDKYAQEIANYIEEKSNKGYEVKQATLYSALKRLENSKFVKPYWNDIPESGRRKFYNLTDKGRNFATKQLSDWSYSKNVIDILVDKPSAETDSAIEKAKPETISVIKPDVEKQNITEAPPTPIYQTNSVPPILIVNSESKIDKQPVVNEPTNNYIKYTPEHKNPFNEVNYKQIISNLFSKAPENKNISNENLNKPISAPNIVDEKSQKLSAETSEPISISDIDKESYVKQKKIGKIDFTDLIEQASFEGYKIRVSSKSSKQNIGSILINKVNLLSSILVLMLFLSEIFLLTFTKINLKQIYLIYTLPIFLLLLIICAVKYIKNSKKNTFSYNKSYVFTSLIIAFNLLLLVFAYNLLAATDFSNKLELITKVVSPLCLLVDFVMFYVFRNIFAKSKKCISK